MPRRRSLVAPSLLLAAAVLGARSAHAQATPPEEPGSPEKQAAPPAAEKQAAPAGEAAVDVLWQAVTRGRQDGRLARVLGDRHWVSDQKDGTLVLSVHVEDEGDALRVRSVWNTILPEPSRQMMAALNQPTRFEEDVTFDASGVRTWIFRTTAGAIVAHRDDGALWTLGPKQVEIPSGRDALPLAVVGFVLPALLGDAPRAVPVRLMSKEADPKATTAVLRCTPADGGLLRCRLERRTGADLEIQLDALVRLDGERAGELLAVVLEPDHVYLPVSAAEASKLLGAPTPAETPKNKR
jgi:hypothetical protein